MSDPEKNSHASIEIKTSNASTVIGEVIDLDDKAYERKIVRKLDFIIMPLLMITMFLACLGRTDIANAKAGLPSVGRRPV